MHKTNTKRTSKPGEWVCNKCKFNHVYETSDTESDAISNDIVNLNTNVNVSDIDFEKYDKMAFNPLRYENMFKESKTYDENTPKGMNIECVYAGSDQLNQSISRENANFTLFNLNIRSLNKNFDQLNQCLKSVNHKFAVIALTETKLKDKPFDYVQLPGYKMEYINRVGRNSGGVFLYIRNDVKYKLRTDLCTANSNFELGFIEIENNKGRNTL